MLLFLLDHRRNHHQYLIIITRSCIHLILMISQREVFGPTRFAVWVPYRVVHPF